MTGRLMTPAEYFAQPRTDDEAALFWRVRSEFLGLGMSVGDQHDEGDRAQGATAGHKGVGAVTSRDGRSRGPAQSRTNGSMDR